MNGDLGVHFVGLVRVTEREKGYKGVYKCLQMHFSMIISRSRYKFGFILCLCIVFCGGVFSNCNTSICLCVHIGRVFCSILF